MKRLAAILTATTLAVAGLVAVAPAAHASDFCDYEDDTKPTISSMTPTHITLGTAPKVVRFAPIAQDDCGIDGWSIQGDDFAFYVYDAAPTEAMDMYDNDDAGLGYATVTVNDPAYNQTIKIIRYRLLRNASFRSGSFNASPEPVRKSGKITVKGTLARADWESDSYRNYAKQTVWIQFKAKGKSTFSTITSVKTDSAGAFSTKLSASRGDGTWRATYAGNSVTGSATSSTDFVDVR